MFAVFVVICKMNVSYSTLAAFKLKLFAHSWLQLIFYFLINYYDYKILPHFGYEISSTFNTRGRKRGCLEYFDKFADKYWMD